MNNPTSVISLAYDKRKQIGEKIKVHASKRHRREDLITTIKEVGACPWSNSAREMYLSAFQSVSTSLPLKVRMQFALNVVINYFGNDIQAMDLRVTYFTEAKSSIWYSNHLHLMLESREFESLH